MEFEEIIALAEKDEPWIIDIFQNSEENYIGTVSVYPSKIRKSLAKVYDEGEIELFLDKSEEDLYLEKLKDLPLNESEIEQVRTFLTEEEESYANLSDEEISEIGLQYFKRADKSILLKRLKVRDVQWTFAAMMRNFDIEISNSFLRILSTAQMRATNEIRKELGLPTLSKKQMMEFIDKPHRETENLLLNTKQGGKRKQKGFVWKPENKINFYAQVEALPKIKNKSMWEYALKELMEKDFDFYIEEYLRKKTPFKDVSLKLFKEAVKVWRKYKDELITIEPNEKPRAFEYRHALHLLKYPEITFSTADKYFREGKKLSNTSK